MFVRMFVTRKRSGRPGAVVYMAEDPGSEPTNVTRLHYTPNVRAYSSIMTYDPDISSRMLENLSIAFETMDTWPRI